jgi:hypothetical protein
MNTDFLDIKKIKKFTENIYLRLSAKICVPINLGVLDL